MTGLGQAVRATLAAAPAPQEERGGAAGRGGSVVSGISRSAGIEPSQQSWYDGGPFGVLVICTGNVCRSPAIGTLLVARARGLGLNPQGWLAVHTAGAAAVVGAPLHRDTAAALASVGVPVDGAHVARQLIPPDVASADLVLTATREHRSVAVRAYPPAVQRTFTLLELARLVAMTDIPMADHDDPGTVPASAAQERGLPARARQLVVTARARRGLARLADPADDDLPDPIGRPPEVHIEMVRRADDAIRAILTALVADPSPGASG